MLSYLSFCTALITTGPVWSASFFIRFLDRIISVVAISKFSRLLTSVCSWAGAFASYLVAPQRRQILSWRGSFQFIILAYSRDWWTLVPNRDNIKCILCGHNKVTSILKSVYFHRIDVNAYQMMFGIDVVFSNLIYTSSSWYCQIARRVWCFLQICLGQNASKYIKQYLI